MQSKKINVFGIETHYIEAGDEQSDKILVILHGWGSSTWSWRKVAEGLEESGIRLVMPDLPGFGQTQEPERPWRLKDYVEFIKTFVDLLGIKKFTLAGHSFGGQIAVAFAAQHQKDLDKLILISVARIAKRRKLRITIFRVLTKIGNLLFYIPPLFFVKPLFKKLWYKIAGERDYYRSSKLMRDTMKLVLEKEVVGHLLNEIRIPTLILWGDKDDVTPLEDGEIINKQIPGSILHLFKGQGHPINRKVPDKIVEEIKKFI